MSTVQQAAPAVCPDGAHMGEHACTNRSQCWEPCGELGHSEEHAKAIHPDDEAVDRFAAELKAKLADARAKGRGGWEDKAQVSAATLSDMLLAHVFKGDPRDVANFAMFLHQRGEGITLADGPRMEHAVEVFQTAEQRCAEHHAGAGRLIEPGIAVQAGLIAAAPFLIGAPPPPVAGGYRGVSWRANGDANSYHLLRGGRWLAHILMNGELFVSQQTDMLERIVIALGGAAEQGGAADPNKAIEHQKEHAT